MMKLKTIMLFIAIVTGIFTASAADSSLVWGWCQEPAMAGPFPPGLYSNSAIGFPSSLTHKYNGCYVESILVCKGYFVDEPTIDLFMAKGEEIPNDWGSITMYTDEPFVSMKDMPFTGDQWEWVEFQLPEPYMIVADEPFYAGWGYLNTSEENMPLVSDNIPNDNLASSWMEGYMPEDPYYGYWNNCGSAGANCIRLRISGENLPSDDIVITGIDAPRYVITNQPVDITLAVSNAASSDIKEVEIKYAIVGGSEKTVSMTDLAIAPGEKYNITLKDIAVAVEGNVMLDIEITSVNGKGDADVTNNMMSCSILSLPEGKGYKRNVVVEEGTGTWCGNCPRGIVGMREMAEKYPDNFIGIAVHCNDEMAIDSYQSYLNRYIDVVGYPYSTIDRAISGDPRPEELETNFLREADIPAIADLKIEETSMIGDMIYVYPSVRFAVSEENTDYGWAYVVTEDNVGPYVQTNYYTDGSLQGWDYTTPQVMMYYDEVALAANNVMGISTIPSSIEADKTYSLPMTFDASRVQNIDNAHVIVMLLNKKTGFIENAVRSSLNTSGVATVAHDSSMINVRDGSITLISGNHADIYDISGNKIGILMPGESKSVDRGVYLVNVDDKTYKVAVR